MPKKPHTEVRDGIQYVLNRRHTFTEWPTDEARNTLQFRTCTECGHQQTRTPLGDGHYFANGRVVDADGHLVRPER